MSFNSFAQNFEDVMLWRAPKLFEPGRYIDAGANHPTHHSVTRAFYEDSWRAGNVEPVEHYYSALCEERPENVNLSLAVAPQAGELTLYEQSATELSTSSEDMRAVQQGAGIQLVPRTVQTGRLDSLCEAHMPLDAPFHFLKIDVEGFERQVLESMDFVRWRPWIVVLESAFDKQPDWEDLFTAANYRYAYCDGINRYYVTQEHAHLVGPLSLAPSVLDEFQLCPGHLMPSSAQEVEMLREALQQTEQRTLQAEQQLAMLQASRSWRLVRRLAQWKARLGRHGRGRLEEM